MLVLRRLFIPGQIVKLALDFGLRFTLTLSRACPSTCGLRLSGDLVFEIGADRVHLPLRGGNTPDRTLDTVVRTGIISSSTHLRR